MKTHPGALPLLFLLLATSTCGWADETSHLAAARELLQVTRAEQLLTQSLGPVEDTQRRLVQKLTTSLDVETAQRVADEILKATNEIVMKDLSWTAMEVPYARAYMNAFSEEDLRVMSQFYKSPLGQKVLDKTPGLMTDIITLTTAKTEQVLPQMRQAAEKAAEQAQKKKSPPVQAQPQEAVPAA
ncbi:MAG: DUF2059 domain-containing protein [Candidatus Methylacidiphilales bacterium]|nr:DUF2059 domain-containing protein [Candidatus Methylacidiphilales bacterium]